LLTLAEPVAHGKEAPRLRVSFFRNRLKIWGTCPAPFQIVTAHQERISRTILPSMNTRSCHFAAALALLFLARGYAQSKPVDFQRDVQPILAEHCAKCHGSDPGTREGELRLDVRDAALQGGGSGEPAIVPGKPDESALVRRISSQDPDELMPPPMENKPLNAQQIATLKQWITEGANYAGHWAFTAPQKKELPKSAATHPIDAWVRAKLESSKLEPSPPATNAALCRRLYLDLIGLPPSPQELDAFEKNGFAATLESLLHSERFGEKWARHWLDVARYSDTNGYEKDMPRDQWAWRDWVISALNRDMPYDQFIIEQIAGDLLPNSTQEQIIATGFLRNSMINEEGAIIPEQFRMFEMFDRMDCVGKAVLGLTLQCAQCHSHKFDPISQDEYYGLFAFLNNAYEAQSWVYTNEQREQIRKVDAAISAIEDRLRSQRPLWQEEIAAWEAGVVKQLADWKPLDATELGSVSGLSHPTQEADKSLLMRGHPSGDIYLVARPELKGIKGITGLRLEALTHGDMPFQGPGRGKTGTWGVTEIEVSIQKPDAKDWEKIKLVNASADFSEPEQKRDDKNDKKLSGPVRYLIDGTDDTWWRADRGIGRRNQASVAVMQFEKPLDFLPNTQMKVAMRMNEMLGCCRLSITTTPNPAVPAVDHAAVLAMQTPSSDRTPQQKHAIFTAWRASVTDLKPFNDEIDSQWKQYPEALTSVLHLAERERNNGRRTHLLERGGWDHPQQPVEPHTPELFHSLAESGSRDRLALARWLVDKRSPLTARVAVNRVWQAMFGDGLVDTPEDFGTRTAMPEHRELLDWLAVDFMEHGWSHKHLIKTIVTSATYQQSSQASPSLTERDPRNRLLARGPRFRADAEVVRDIALSVSGLMMHKIGGPGVIPPVPQNVLDYNYVYPSYWKATEGPDRYRRAVYGFRKRSMPDPVMSSFDAPNGDFACARRVRSNTPIAALAGLNETIFVEAARALALRILREGGASDADRANYAFRLCVARLPTDSERDEILALLKSRRLRLADGWLNPRDISTGDAAKLPELPQNTTPQDAAAWTLVARVLLNLDETITKN
jgi:hypothetical protein